MEDKLSLQINRLNIWKVFVSIVKDNKNRKMINFKSNKTKIRLNKTKIVKK
jgi:hypothetical protein